jgi:GntR family transcriptional regulator/MocR family aminotransferase
VLVEPGMAVAVEEPGYRPVRGVFTAQGARVLSVPVDDEGIDVDAIPRGVRLVYVTPSHQYPLGTPMSLARRTALLDWAQRNGAVIVEDDYDSEFRYSERPLEPLQSLDRSGRVIYVGSFSKTMLPMLRIGFLIAPSSLQGALRTAKQLSDWAGDVMLQAALARFLDEGLLARHIRRCTREYASRRAEIGDVIASELGDLLEMVPSAAGMHLCARAVPRTGVVWARAVEKAAHHGVRAYSLDSFYADQVVHNGLVLGFGAVRPESLAEGLHRLVAAIRS